MQVDGPMALIFRNILHGESGEKKRSRGRDRATGRKAVGVKAEANWNTDQRDHAQAKLDWQ